MHLHYTNIYLFSVSTKTTHILQEKAGQKPEVMTSHSAQFLNTVVELDIPLLHGCKNYATPC